MGKVSSWSWSGRLYYRTRRLLRRIVASNMSSFRANPCSLPHLSLMEGPFGPVYLAEETGTPYLSRSSALQGLSENEVKEAITAFTVLVAKDVATICLTTQGGYGWEPSFFIEESSSGRKFCYLSARRVPKDCGLCGTVDCFSHRHEHLVKKKIMEKATLFTPAVLATQMRQSMSNLIRMKSHRLGGQLPPCTHAMVRRQIEENATDSNLTDDIE